ncbi:hypothetical protein TNCV_600821 [Trichonephila clavipes]|nr:hypothetical protein TNCV_600821 [Trichonephila clavipes]
MASRRHFSTRQCSASYGKDVIRLYLHCYCPSLVCPIPRFILNRGSFGPVTWASHEFVRTRGNVTAAFDVGLDVRWNSVCGVACMILVATMGSRGGAYGGLYGMEILALLRAEWMLSHWLEVEVNIASGWLSMGDSKN